MTEAIGMSSTLGVAVGGAIITVAGVASGLAHGIARGASIGSNVVQLALPATSEDDFLSVGDSVEADRQGGRPSEEVRLATRRITVATPRRGVPDVICAGVLRLEPFVPLFTRIVVIVSYD